MAYKALLFGTDELYPQLKPLYDAQAKIGNLELVATAELQGDNVNIVYTDGRRGGVEDIPKFDLAIVSSRYLSYPRMKQLEGFSMSRNKIIDGRIFYVPNLDFPRLIKDGVAYGIFENPNSFQATAATFYPINYKFKKMALN